MVPYYWYCTIQCTIQSITLFSLSSTMESLELVWSHMGKKRRSQQKRPTVGYKIPSPKKWMSDSGSGARKASSGPEKGRSYSSHLNYKKTGVRWHRSWRCLGSVRSLTPGHGQNSNLTGLIGEKTLQRTSCPHGLLMKSREATQSQAVEALVEKISLGRSHEARAKEAHLVADVCICM